MAIYNNSSAYNKRKSGADSPPLEERIKKCRISHTPGELRLQKDMQDLMGIEGIVIETTDNPATIIVHFNSSPPPSRFSITVPRYYPHARPIVQCLDHFVESLHLHANGIVYHSSLMDNWTALYSLSTVIEVLHCVRHHALCGSAAMLDS
eukprot:gene26749-35059_t